MQQEPLVSIVIPIYNVEKYINRCVDSIVSQTYKNLEIILVDDGSPDNLKVVASKEVPNEAKINDNMEFIDLSEDISKWVNSILLKDNMRRGTRCAASKDYNIVQQALKLQNYYRGVFDEHWQRRQEQNIVPRQSQ